MFGAEDECKTGQFLSEKLTKAKKSKCAWLRSQNYKMQDFMFSCFSYLLRADSLLLCQIIILERCTRDVVTFGLLLSRVQ